MKKVLLFTMFVIFFTGCSQVTQSNPLPSQMKPAQVKAVMKKVAEEAIRHIHVDGKKKQIDWKLRVVTFRNPTPNQAYLSKWLLQKDDSKEEHIASNISGMSVVYDIKASLDGRYLAVFSMGEGAQLVEVFDLGLLLEEKKVKVLRSFSPFPGGIIIKEWKDGRLIVNSGALMTHADEDGRIPLCLHEMESQTYAIDIKTGQIEALSEGARNPVEYFTKKLSSKHPYEREEAALALKFLKIKAEYSKSSYIIKELSEEVEIVAQANSLKALIKIAEPDCVWGETNMMWAVKDANGLSEIVLNQAFIYELEGGVPKWVLLDRANRRRGGEYYHTVVKLCEKIPYIHEHWFSDYTMLRGTNKEVGKVYEIGWMAEDSRGTSLASYWKRMYFLERCNGRWVFIGEGPRESTGKWGYCKSYVNEVKDSNVVWTGNPDNPVQIEFTFKKGKYMWCSSDDGPDCIDPPDLVYYRDGILSMGTGGKTQWVDLPYTLTERGDSLKMKPAQVKAVMKKVADWQLAHRAKHRTTDWTYGALFAGLSAYAQMSDTDKYYDALHEFGEKNNWQFYKRIYHADDHAVGQMYLEMYEKFREPKMIEGVRERFDYILTHKPDTRLEFKSKNSQYRYSWCDALFMSPPVWAKLSAITGEKKYLDYMNQEWWATTDYLLDTDEKLYYRDSRYFDKREANGEKVFWSRGNGWVMGGLVRVLGNMPEDYPDRPRYIALFKQMAKKIVAIQPEEGLWHSSLLDPVNYPTKEASGSGFYCYALAWGINNGLLDEKTYFPAVKKSWLGLVDCVHPDGMLGHVQPIGQDPKQVKAHQTEIYGVGSFLLAGCEVYKLAQKKCPEVFSDENSLQIRQLSPDGTWVWFNDERTIIDGQNLLIGSVDSNGFSQVDVYNIKDQSRYNCPLSSWKSKDDHNNPALLKMSNGKILACYAQHGREKKWYRRIGDYENGKLVFGPEQQFEVPAKSSYNNLVQLSAENGRIYNFSRNVNFNPNFQYSDDFAKTWQGPFLLLKTGSGHIRPYVKFCDKGTDRIDFLYTDGHPRKRAANNVYHMYYKAGSFYKSDGTLIKTMAQAKQDPIAPSDGTVIYDGSSRGRGWIWDIEYDQANQPVAVFINSFDHEVGNDLRYRYARWNEENKTWTQQQIAFAGTGIYVPENHYAGGICIDPENINRVYISSDVNPVTGLANKTGHYQVYQGLTADKGKTWKWKQLTFDSDTDNFRPIVPRNHQMKTCVLWFQGRYQTYKKFKTRVMGIIETGK